MKPIVYIGMAYAAACAFCAPAKAAPGSATGNVPLTMDEMLAKRAKTQEILMKKVGGLIPRPNTQRGEVFYVNCQQRAPKEWIDESIMYFSEETKFKISYKEGVFDLAAPKVEGNATLFVIDDEKLPAILVAPENRWAFVNIAPIAAEKRPAFFQARTKKEMSRGFAYLCGAANSQFPMALTRGIVSHSDFDKNIDYRLPVDLFQRFRTYMEPLGVTPQILAPYRKAVQEGWAPAPTNDVQQAIWDKVHAMPTEPLKIKPETKKVLE